ncbi:MAG: cytochrome c oxidase subunit II [Caulobacteraceae bacterium]
MAAQPFSPAWPMGYMQTFGPRADPATALTWGVTLISLAVIAIITLLVVWGVVARRARGGELPPVTKREAGHWIWIGLIPTTITLAVSLVWTVAVLAKINSPASKPAFTLEITGHQWWWGVRYVFDQPGETFSTANEIHIPVGRPVLVKAMSADVIHSFWVPALTGKTDTIPGRANIAWLEADRAGIYRGQCTEYCGEEHAGMAVYVVAEPQAAFDAWRQAQQAPASAPASPQAASGQAIFQAHCAACHEVRGTDAGGVLGPDLTHVASRATIASGMLPNTRATLAGWISNPAALKPGVLMPATELSGPDLNAVTAYVESLK